MKRRPRNPKNKTKYVTLDALADDPRIQEIYDEEEDGIWASLAPGYNVDGSSSIHGLTPDYPGAPSARMALLEEVKRITKGDPY